MPGGGRSPATAWAPGVPSSGEGAEGLTHGQQGQGCRLGPLFPPGSCVQGLGVWGLWVSFQGTPKPVVEKAMTVVLVRTWKFVLRV